MADRETLLIEIGTEELPPAPLYRLAQSLFDGVCSGLSGADLKFDAEASRHLASPRRLAVVVESLQTRQADREELRLGPAVAAAFDSEGNPTRAAEGFARSVGASVDELARHDEGKGERLAFRRKVAGRGVEELLQDVLNDALRKLPIPKPMRWGAREASFIRPVHWVVALLGADVLPVTLFDLAADRSTRGHRFHAPDAIELAHARDYSEQLRAAKVEVDPAQRQQQIRQQVESLAQSVGGQARIEDALLAEVSALVEWPVAVLGGFDAEFLQVPAEALVSSMETHQRFFPIIDSNGALMPHFVAVANIESSRVESVIAGLNRVVRPRLADAAFFWNQDQAKPLVSRHTTLGGMVYQQRLGSLLDKTERIERLAEALASQLDVDVEKAKRAASLCKCDLVTEMVYEFPELQGVMGRYYAQAQGEDPDVAAGLEQHYLPRFAGDVLPSSPCGRVLAIADRLDTLAGIFAAGLKPTGNRDPFALRRAALGLIRLLIEGGIELDLAPWLERALAAIEPRIEDAPQCHGELLSFIMERLRAYYVEQGTPGDVFDAVWALRPTQLCDFDRRVRACAAFRDLEQAAALAAANKRIGNILKKSEDVPAESIDPNLLEAGAEQALHEAVQQAREETSATVASGDYQAALTRLASLRPIIDQYFDDVMVMVDDVDLRKNRLALLAGNKGLFDDIADISQLQIES